MWCVVCTKHSIPRSGFSQSVAPILMFPPYPADLPPSPLSLSPSLSLIFFTQIISVPLPQASRMGNHSISEASTGRRNKEQPQSVITTIIDLPLPWSILLKRTPQSNLGLTWDPTEKKGGNMWTPRSLFSNFGCLENSRSCSSHVSKQLKLRNIDLDVAELQQQLDIIISWYGRMGVC